MVRYHKRFFYCDHAFKGTVEGEFDQFIEKCQKKYEGGQKRGLLRGKGKIEFIVEGMKTEMGFCVTEDHNYKLMFVVTLLTGMGAYYDLFMKKKVVRYELDITKEVRPQ